MILICRRLGQTPLENDNSFIFVPQSCKSLGHSMHLSMEECNNLPSLRSVNGSFPAPTISTRAKGNALRGQYLTSKISRLFNSVTPIGKYSMDPAYHRWNSVNCFNSPIESGKHFKLLQKWSLNSLKHIRLQKEAGRSSSLGEFNKRISKLLKFPIAFGNSFKFVSHKYNFCRDHWRVIYRGTTSIFWQFEISKLSSVLIFPSVSFESVNLEQSVKQRCLSRSKFPKDFGNICRLEQLDKSRYWRFVRFPKELGNSWRQLQPLKLRCWRFVRFPNAFGSNFMPVPILKYFRERRWKNSSRNVLI